MDVLRLVSEGLSNPAIAEELYIAVGTVSNHLGQIHIRLGLSHNRNFLNLRVSAARAFLIDQGFGSVLNEL